MKKEEVIEQLESLIDDRKSFYDPDDDPAKTDGIFRKDVEALEEAIRMLNEPLSISQLSLVNSIADEAARLSNDNPSWKYAKAIETAANSIGGA